MRESFTDLEPEEEELLRDLAGPVRAMRARRAQCPSPQIIRAAGSGVLPEETNASVLKHLESCALCRTLARDVDSLDLPRPAPEEAKRIEAEVFGNRGKARKKISLVGWSWLWRPAPVAALAAVALLAAGWLYVSRSPAPSQPTQVAVSPPPPEPSTVFRLEKPAARLPMAAVLVWRGEGRSTQERFLRELKLALEPYLTDNFSEAAERLEKLTQKYPRAAEPYFYLGVSQLFVKQNVQAIQSLERAKQLARGSMAQDVSWYLSLAYQRAGETAKARGELQKLCQGKGDLAARACTGLQEMSAAPGGSPAR